MTTTVATSKPSLRQRQPRRAGYKGNLAATVIGVLVFGFLTGLTPPAVRAATWDAVKAATSLDGTGLVKIFAKEGNIAKAKAKALFPNSPGQVAARGQALLASGALTTTTEAQCNPLPDLQSGKMFPQDIVFLERLVAAGFKVRVSCIHWGHSPNVANTTRTSLHFDWKGVDIDQVNGQPVCENLVGTGDSRKCLRVSAASLKLSQWFFSQPNSQLPFEVGGPITPGSRGKSVGPNGARGGPFFTNPGHQGHFHIGFKPADPLLPPGTWWTG